MSLKKEIREEIKEKIYESYGIEYEKQDVPEEIETTNLVDDEIEDSEELLLDDLIIE